MKLVTIGGGSSYTPELVEGIIARFKNLNVKEWWLVDLPESTHKLEIIASLARRMFLKKGIKITVIATLDLQKALVQADFVTTQIRVGQMQARYFDEHIPSKYGFLGQETNGIGGAFKALRTVPVILDIVEKVKKWSKPNCWIINFANPSGLVTEAVNQLTDFKNFIGLCNVPIHTKINIAKLLNISLNEFSIDAIGLNHLVYFTDFYKKQSSIKQEVLEKVQKENSAEILTMANVEKDNWNSSLIKHLGALPCPYHKYYYKSSTMLQKSLDSWKKGELRSEIIMKLEKKLFKKYADPDLKEKPEELNLRGGAFYSDVALGVIESIHNNLANEFVVNTINDHKVSNLPSDWVIETTCKITKNGAEKISRKIQCPSGAIGLINSIKTFELALIKAIQFKDKSQAEYACLINPLVTDDVKGSQAFKELFEKHKKYLTYFN